MKKQKTMCKESLNEVREESYYSLEDLLNKHELESETLDFIIKKGDDIPIECFHEDRIALITRGAVMVYWKDENKEKLILDFKKEDEILRPAIVLDTTFTGEIYGKALTDVEIKLADRLYFCSIAGIDDKIGNLYYKLLGNDISSSHRQLKLLKNTNIEERYLCFLQWYKDVYNELTDRMVANFLGIHYTTLSRVKARILARERQNSATQAEIFP